MDSTALVVIVGIAIAAIALVAWWALQRRQRAHLRERFGPEYDRTLRHVGDLHRAEADLAAREKRVARFQIRQLTADEATRFGEVWNHVQALFVDDPRGAIDEADRLVAEVMTARGYPMADFDQRVSDVSVDHPVVVEHYRAARDIAARHKRGEATTEDLRQALVHYRTLFDDLLEVKRPELKAEVRA